MDGLIHAASSPTLLSAPCKLWAGGKAIGRLKLVLCYVEILTYCWNTQNNRPVGGWFDTYQLTQLTLSSQRAVEVEKLLAVEKPMHNVIYVQCRMWGCGMTVFPLSALLRLELPVHLRDKIFHESTCRYGRSSPRTGWPGSTSGHESPAVCMTLPGTSTR